MNFMIKTIRRSIVYYSRDVFNQVLIIMLLSAIITGSLFTGHSVRESLRKGSAEKIGNTGILISSGSRFFNSSVASKISEVTGDIAVAILETEGYCQNFATGGTALNTRIYSVTESFWQFQGIENLNLEPGRVAVNSKLAKHIGVNVGDEIIVRFSDTDPIPDNAPFAPSEDNNNSRVLVVDYILDVAQGGNFSLGISQIIPMNIFLTYEDLNIDNTQANRLLIDNSTERNADYYYNTLGQILKPSDVGLTVRESPKTGEKEIISDRIFIDSLIVTEILKVIPGGRPVLTYLANNIEVRGHSTPYSFVTSQGSDIGENVIWITKWVSEDIKADIEDTLTLTWYDPSYANNQLEEKQGSFVVGRIIPDDHENADPSLMPDFPGISGSTTCSGWDAGVPILMDRIRDKDEKYWNKYRGTPKAFIDYETGKRIWGNNFGKATAIRFPESFTADSIISKLSGNLDPRIAGFSISDPRIKTNDAADESVNFSTLFLSLAFFIIVSSVILLSLAISMFFETRKGQIRTYFALGFTNRKIRKILLSESMAVSLAGSITGIFMGYLLSILTIIALNSVWTGAVQTNTLSVHFSIIPLLTGFFSTEAIVFLLLIYKTNMFLRNLNRKESGDLKEHLPNRNGIVLVFSTLITIAVIIISVFIEGGSVMLTFAGGTLLFITFILIIRDYLIRKREVIPGSPAGISGKYYYFHPSHFFTPILFIAAGIFAVMITGSNKKVINDKMLLPSGGTGAYLLWAESAVPVRENLNAEEGREEFGLDEEELKDMIIVQAKRLPGDDASCLNLNHITSPPILGIDPEGFINRGSFSFATSIKEARKENPWDFLSYSPGKDIIYGIADQTVLEWGLKIKAGDTLVFNAENGQLLKVVICAGLKSSVFQGYLLIGNEHFEKYFPSIEGNSVFLIDGDRQMAEYYTEVMSQRFSGYGLSVEDAGTKLASFHVVTNTYLDVFVVLGIFGMILGAAGLGFILILNFNRRKGEFALLMATGYSMKQIRKILFGEQLVMLFIGVLTGTLSGLFATMQSLRSGSEIPWIYIPITVAAVFGAGLIALLVSLNNVRSSTLISLLRKE